MIFELGREAPLREAALRAAPGIEQLLRDAGFKPNENTVTPPGQRDFYEWYFAYGAILRPARVLEIGVFGGASMFSLCAGAGSGVVHKAWLLDDESGIGRVCTLDGAAIAVRRHAREVTVLKEDSQRIGRLASRIGDQTLDVISIDGDHRVGPCYHDLRITLPHLGENGHVICDDGNWPWVQDAVSDFLAEHPDLTAFRVNTFTGTIVIHRKGHEPRCPLMVKP
jgi:hypothetical protein